MEVVAVVIGLLAGLWIVWEVIRDRRTKFCPRCGAAVVEVVAFLDKHDRYSGRSESKASVERVCSAVLGRSSRSDHFGWSYGTAAYKATKVTLVDHKEAVG